MAKAYAAPEWARASKHDLHLSVLKGGVQMDSISLSERDHFIFGRQPDIVHVPLDHPSISRQHAVLQLGDDDSIYVFDLNSAHGTFVNKKRVISEVYHRIFVGDFIRFGESSRLYTLEGPEELMPPEDNSEAIVKYKQKLMKRSAEAEQREKEGVSWGLADDVDPEEMEGGEHDIPYEELPDYLKNDPLYMEKYRRAQQRGLDENDVHERDRKIFEKLKAKEMKVSNLEEEIRRIKVKDNAQGGLTEGQQAAIARNEKVIEKLQGEIDELQATIETKNSQRRATRAQLKAQNKAENRADEDDDFYDRTKQTASEATNWRLRRKRRRGGNDVASSSTTDERISFKSLDERRAGLQKELDDIAKRITALPSNTSVPDAGVDQFDQFMALNNAQSQHQELQALTRRESDLRRELASVSELLEFTRPALPSLKPGPSIRGTGTDVSDRDDPPNTHAHIDPHKTDVDAPTADPVPQIGSQEEVQDSNPSNPNPNPTDTHAHTPTDKETHTPTDTQTHPQTATHQHPNPSANLPKPKKKRVKGPSKPPNPNSSLTPNLKPDHPNPNLDPNPNPNPSTTLEGGEAAWVPPKGQTGDGRTKLNEKYGY